MNESLQYLYFRVKKSSITKEQAQSKVCQEVFISKLGSDLDLSQRVSFKGGIIIDFLSGGQRGFTKDIDFDLIKYPISEDGITSFINKINNVNVFANIKITIDKLESLKHKNYEGKRALLSFSDGTSIFKMTVDIGAYYHLVKRNSSIDYVVAFGEKRKLLVNPIERMLAEKLSTFAIYGLDNSRDKDYFDAIFLLNNFEIDHASLNKMLNQILVRKNHYYKTLRLGINAIIDTLSDKNYQNMLDNSKRNWQKINVSDSSKHLFAFLNDVLNLLPKHI